jgi:hypothetical protein
VAASAAAAAAPRRKAKAGAIVRVGVGHAPLAPSCTVVMVVVAVVVVVAKLAWHQSAAAARATLPVPQLEPAAIRQPVVVTAVRRVLKRNRRSTAARLARGALLKPLQQHLTLRARPRLLCVRIACLRLPLGQQRVGAAPTPKPDGVIGEHV